MVNPKRYLDFLDLRKKAAGHEERLGLLHDVLDGGGLTPPPVGLKDIDQAFRDFADKEMAMVADSGDVFPTMNLYSNQRFSEYTQSWNYTDSNQNLLLNFKTIRRETNPQWGREQAGGWNIPGKRYWTMLQKRVLDDNGSESLLTVKAAQPACVDLKYTLSVFTTKFEKLNEFNELVNRAFSSRQKYLFPKGYAMAATLDGIADASSYNISDRQFYAQSCTITVNAYLFSEDDFRVENAPIKSKLSTRGLAGTGKGRRKIADIEIDECGDEEGRFYKKPVTLTMTFPPCTNVAEFTIDTNFTVESVELKNTLKNYVLKVNGEKVDVPVEGFSFSEYDVVRVSVGRMRYDESAVVVFKGYDPTVTYDSEKDIPEFTEDTTQFADDYEMDVPERKVEPEFPRCDEMEKPAYPETWEETVTELMPNPQDPGPEGWKEC